MRNHPCPIGESLSCSRAPAVPQWTRGFRYLSPATQGRCVSADDPRVRQSRGCRRCAHRSFAQSLPPFGSAARIRSLPRMAGADRETRLLAIEGARISASAPAAFYIGGRRPRARRVGTSFGYATRAARDEASAEECHGGAAGTLSPGLRIVRCRGFAGRRGCGKIRHLASGHEISASSRSRFGEEPPRHRARSSISKVAR